MGLGGNGIVADYKVARFFADCEALYSYEGTYQMQNLILGPQLAVILDELFSTQPMTHWY